MTHADKSNFLIPFLRNNLWPFLEALKKPSRDHRTTCAREEDNDGLVLTRDHNSTRVIDIAIYMYLEVDQKSLNASAINHLLSAWPGILVVLARRSGNLLSSQEDTSSSSSIPLREINPRYWFQWQHLYQNARSSINSAPGQFCSLSFSVPWIARCWWHRFSWDCPWPSLSTDYTYNLTIFCNTLGHEPWLEIFLC
jgi:hypothetical protein